MLPKPLQRVGCTLDGPFPQRVHGLTRRTWAHVLAELGYRTGAEIGVRQGAFSEWLCQSIPWVQLRCVDAWKAYRAHPVQARHEENYRVACARLAAVDVTVCRMSSVEAVRAVPMRSLDFVYIDANHRYQFVRADVRRWARRVRAGGIVAGDDYEAPGVQQAVHEQVVRDGIGAWWLMDDPQRRNRRGQAFTSWFWVQP